MKGKTLRGIRKRLGWTQVQLAKAVGLTPNTIARQERDEVTIGEPLARLVKILSQQKKEGRVNHGNKEAEKRTVARRLSRR